MKLEPLKQTRLPKYAAALGVLASVTLLTGCGQQLAGDVAVPVDSQDIVELGGDAYVDPDWTEPAVTGTTAPETDLTAATAEPVLEGEINPFDETCIVSDEKRPPHLTGLVPCIEDVTTTAVTAPPADPVQPLTLEGDVAFIPDYQDAVDNVNRFYEVLAESYETGFETKGYIMTRDSRRFSHFGTTFTSVLKHKDTGTLLAFYDGDAEDQGVKMREWMQGVCTASYDWGCVLDYPADADGYHRVIFVDTARDFDSAITDAEQIYKDVIE